MKSHPKFVRPQLNLTLLDRTPAELPQDLQKELALALVQKTLLQPDFAKLPGLVKNRAHIISRVMEIAEKNNGAILYAP